MEEFSGLSKFFIFFGLIFLFIGLFLMFFPKIPLLGKIPGDIYIKKDKFTFYFPLGTSILLSLLFTLLLNLLFRK